MPPQLVYAAPLGDLCAPDQPCRSLMNWGRSRALPGGAALSTQSHALRSELLEEARRRARLLEIDSEPNW